jgi:hypothetical protein
VTREAKEHVLNALLSGKAKIFGELVQVRRKLSIFCTQPRKRVLFPQGAQLFGRLTLVWGAATLLLKLLRVHVGRLVVATSAQDRQQVTGELAGR